MYITYLKLDLELEKSNDGYTTIVTVTSILVPVLLRNQHRSILHPLPIPFLLLVVLVVLVHSHHAHQIPLYLVIAMLSLIVQNEHQ